MILFFCCCYLFIFYFFWGGEDGHCIINHLVQLTEVAVIICCFGYVRIYVQVCMYLIM